MNKKEHSVNLDKNKWGETSRLALFVELNPRPVVEVDLLGNVIYQNAAAKKAFPELVKEGSGHKYIAGLPSIVSILKNTKEAFTREIKIDDKWFRHSLYYIPDFESIVIYGLADISVKKKDQKILRDEEKRYHLLFEKMNYGYVLQDIIFDKNKKPVDYRFVDVNPAFEKLSKTKKEQIVGKTASQISPPQRTKEAKANRKKYNEVALTGKPTFFESHDKRTGKYFELYAYKPNEHQIALIFSDITHRKKMDEEKNNFISIMSHELRNPLTPIMANAQFIKLLLSQQESIHPIIKESVDVIEKQAKNMADLLNDILDVSRLSRNKIQLKKSRINIVEIIRSSIKESMPFIDTKQQTLKVFFSQDVIYMHADALRIQQITVNIVNNASKYTQPKGRIVLRCGIKNHMIEISVKDNGIGMESEKIENIFELFSDESQPFMGIGGLGIGLNIVKNLVAMHKGTISVNSKGKNKGSEFIIRFPFVETGRFIKNPVLVKEDTVVDKKIGSKILLVDDQEDILRALSNLLRSKGYIIKTASNGKDAINVYKIFKPDVALVDVGLPDMSGHQVAMVLRKQGSGGKKVKLIAFTGFGQKKDKELAKKAGFDHHVAKPVDIEYLMKLIES